MTLDLTQFHGVFFEESFEALDSMEAALLELDVGTPDKELINTIFRVAHSIKGGSATFGFTAIASFTHTLETLLDELRGGRMQVTTPISNLLLKSVDVMRGMLRAVQSNQTVDAQVVADLQFDLELAIAQKPGLPIAEAAPVIQSVAAAQAVAPVDAPVPSAPVEAPAVTSAAAPAQAAAAAPAAGLGGQDASSIRVSVEKIDELMNTVGELVITQAMLSQLANQLEGGNSENLRMGLAQLERNMRELQESVMRVRMLPISFVFSRFPRMVRDLAQRLDKQIELKLTGEQTELDKTVMEKIGDPLVHLVRNSIDHGIESPATRTAAGKPAVGTVHLDASHKGGSITITVSDDGGGLNAERILAKAKERGLVGANDTLTEEQINDLIFMPGFSTAEKTTDVSGRGVGMDVVRRNVKSLGGSIDVRSKLGAGSRFVITLPLTLAIVDGQTVKVGNETYIVPLVSIVESMQLKPSMVNRITANGEVFWFRDGYLPVIRLHELFGIEPRSRALSEGLVMVVEGEGRKVGLFVDDLLGQQQVVIKSLDTNYGRIEGVSGATILGDGAVALILDLPGLVRSAAHGAASPNAFAA